MRRNDDTPELLTAHRHVQPGVEFQEVANETLILVTSKKPPRVKSIEERSKKESARHGPEINLMSF